ncbi:MAG: ABC transporter permease [Actinobacteria bacterium]|nr:ABC transporter permease [Actinomycetota bacterium]
MRGCALVSRSRFNALTNKQSSFREALYRFSTYRLALLGVAVISIVVFIALFARWLAPLGPTDLSLEEVMSPPGNGHFLGTDDVGRDVWARVAYGARTSMIVGLGAVAIALLIGTTIGLLSGYFGKWADAVLMRITDGVMSVPPLILVIVFISIVGPSLLSVLVVIALTTWPTSARLVRGQVLTLREQEYVVAARVVGVPTRKILTRHLFPNLLGPLSVVATFGISNAILVEAGLSFLGLGVRPPAASWGQMVNLAQQPDILLDKPWIWVPSALMIVVTVLAINFIGDGLRKAVDPKSVR